jgi:hypothetical protein
MTCLLAVQSCLKEPASFHGVSMSFHRVSKWASRDTYLCVGEMETGNSLVEDVESVVTFQARISGLLDPATGSTR